MEAQRDIEEVALRRDQADYAAHYLHRSATSLMPVATKAAIRATVNDPRTSTYRDVRAAYQIARMIRDAFEHAPLTPKWIIDKECRDQVFEVPDIITLDTKDLDGTPFDWRHYGGPLALFRLCRFVRIEILKDQSSCRCTKVLRCALTENYLQRCRERDPTFEFCAGLRPSLDNIRHGLSKVPTQIGNRQ